MPAASETVEEAILLPIPSAGFGRNMEVRKLARAGSWYLNSVGLFLADGWACLLDGAYFASTAPADVMLAIPAYGRTCAIGERVGTDFARKCGSMRFVGTIVESS